MSWCGLNPKTRRWGASWPDSDGYGTVSYATVGLGHAASRGTAPPRTKGSPWRLSRFREGRRRRRDLPQHPMKVTIGIFVVGPTLALLGVIPMIYWGLVSWVDIGLLFGLLAITGLGITVGYHRYFTHGSFKAPCPVKIALAIMGSYALEGSINQWVADHRKHHKFSDDRRPAFTSGGSEPPARPSARVSSSPTWDGSSPKSRPPWTRYAPDIRDDKDLQRINNAFPSSSS